MSTRSRAAGRPWRSRRQSPPSLQGLTGPVGRFCLTDMATPRFTFRLPREARDNLQEVSKICGYLSVSAFLRDLVGTIVSGDGKKIADFNQRMAMRLGEQLRFQWEAAAKAQKPGKVARGPGGRGRRALRR